MREPSIASSAVHPAQEERSQKGKTYIIAEMACSHEGDPQLARKIIDGAGAAGADAIQFQIWSLADIVVPHHPDYPKLAKIELSRKDWTELAEYVRRNHPGMEIIACVYETASVDFGEKIGVNAYKLHSSDLSNPQMLRHVAATGKRIDLSVGASSADEIQAAMDCIREASNSEIWMMYGYQNFPTRIEDVHLRYMMALGRLFGVPIGYQDHTDANTLGAFWIPAAAVGLGVPILEKHITHDRSFKGVDHEAALNPDEFAHFVKMVRDIEAAQGAATPHPFSADQIKYRKYSKKSIVAARELPAGTRVSEADLRFMRADELGLPPDQIGRLLGRTTKKTIAALHLVREDDVA